jgi:hypothetical protein
VPTTIPAATQFATLKGQAFTLGAPSIPNGQVLTLVNGNAPALEPFANQAIYQQTDNAGVSPTGTVAIVGDFTMLGTTSAFRAARFNAVNQTFESLGGTLAGFVPVPNAIVPVGNFIYVFGSFAGSQVLNTSGAAVNSNNVVMWNGADWMRLGNSTGINSAVNDAFYDAANNRIVFAGNFTGLSSVTDGANIPRSGVAALQLNTDFSPLNFTSFPISPSKYRESHDRARQSLQPTPHRPASRPLIFPSQAQRGHHLLLHSTTLSKAFRSRKASSLSLVCSLTQEQEPSEDLST